MRLLGLFLVLASLAAAPAAAAESRLIRASATFQRLGDWRVDRASTFQGAIDALGEPSSCHAREAAHVVARWADLGITVDLVTFGGLPAGRTGCDEPRSIHVNWARVTGRSWFTSLGLRVGDPTSKLRRLYPRAQRNPRGTWPRPSAHWLVTRRAACVGICSTNFVTVPQLLAEVRNGRVIAFFFHVGAQGD
jgi:hypothetical protein